MKKNKGILYIVLGTYLAVLILFLLVLFPAIQEVVVYDMLRKVSIESILLIFTGVIACITCIVVTIVSIYIKNNRENERTNKQLYNIERSYLEREIADLNKKLVSTEERWKEAYHLVMTSQNMQVNSNGAVSAEKFLEGFGINNEEIKIKKDLAFVLTSFHDDYNQTYEVIKSTCNKTKMIAMRGDEEYVPKDVLQHIIKCIVKARVIIANVNGRNPNVFYELGIAHALNKPTILIAHFDTDVPFDLQNQYLVLYKDEKELEERLFDVILKTITKSE